MGGNADLTLAINTGSSLILPMKETQLHLAGRMPAHGGFPFTSIIEEEGTTKSFPVQPSNLLAS